MARRDEPAPPRDCTPDLPEDLDDVAFLSPREEVFAARVAGLAGDVRAAHARLIETELVQPHVEAFDLAGATLADVRIDGIRAVSLASREGRWHNVAITGGRILGRTVESTNDLTTDEASQVIDVVAKVESRAALDALLAGVTVEDPPDDDHQ